MTAIHLLAPVSGGDARRAAQQELSRPEYHRDDPSLLSRAVTWIFDQLARLDGASAGQSALLVLAVILIAAVALLVIKGGRPLRSERSRSARSDPLRPGAGADHLRTAQQHFEAGRYALALQEWLRATAQQLERRGLLDPRPGRTADDIARAGGAQLPEAAGALRTATDAFSAIWFGGRTATAADAEAGRAAAIAVRTATEHAPRSQPPSYAVPG